MIPAPLIWPVALTGSVLLHGVAGTILLWSVEPDPVTEQPVPETRMQLAAYQVDRSTAREAQPDAETAETADPTGARLDQGAIPQTSARAVEARTEPLRVQAASALPLSATPQTGERIAASQDTAQTLAAADATATPLDSTTAQPAPVATIATADQARPVAPAIPQAQTLATTDAQPVALTLSEPETPTAKAADVFATGDGPIDPVSLAAFQSFTRPGDLGQQAQDLRDGIDGLLAQVPCARLQVQFDPDTNQLDLIGHIPEDGLRNPVLAALQTQMGTNIRVTDKLLILPRPQCGALAGIGAVGLPQSTDQITNPLLLGEDVHAREFRYADGQQLVLDLTGADYDAYIYVDYFDAAGQVIHLSPNDSTPLTQTPAKSALTIGAETPGDPGLYITIGPPYGQEIAVAFAASEPLYEGLRPLVEPAGPYLDFLKSRVTAARAADPDFKGEWVYFFVTTAAE